MRTTAKFNQTRTESSIVGADIYLQDKQQEELDARINAWINELVDQNIGTRLGVDEEPPLRSVVDIWRGGIDETSRALAEEFEKLQETNYFRDSYNSTSLFWRYGLSWWHLSENDFIEGKYCEVHTIRGLLDHVLAQKEHVLSESESKKWYEEQDSIDKEESWEVWHEYFVQKTEKFIEFCERTIENNGRWSCSV